MFVVCGNNVSKQADKKNPKSKVVRKHNSCDSSVHATVISNPSFDMKIPMQEL
jgi:hypothetical protein